MKKSKEKEIDISSVASKLFTDEFKIVINELIKEAHHENAWDDVLKLNDEYNKTVVGKDFGVVLLALIMQITGLISQREGWDEELALIQEKIKEISNAKGYV